MLILDRDRTLNFIISRSQRARVPEQFMRGLHDRAPYEPLQANGLGHTPPPAIFLPCESAEVARGDREAAAVEEATGVLDGVARVAS